VFVEQMRYGKAYPSISQWGAGPNDPIAVRNQLDEMSKSIDSALHAPAVRRSAQ
jgi:hypothetical protein